MQEKNIVSLNQLLTEKIPTKYSVMEDKKQNKIDYFKKENDFIEIFSNNEKRELYVKEIRKEIEVLKDKWKNTAVAIKHEEIKKKIEKLNTYDKKMSYVILASPLIIDMLKDLNIITSPTGIGIVFALIVCVLYSFSIYKRIKLENEQKHIFFKWFKAQNSKYSLLEYATMDKNKTVLGLKNFIKDLNQISEVQATYNYVASKIIKS